MTPELWVALIIAVLSFIGTIYGHLTVSKTSREKTVQAVKDEMSAIRTESQAKDQEMHAEILMMKQELMSQNDLTRKEIEALSKRVEKHNGVIDRTYALEQKAAVQEEQIKVANHRIDDLEKLTAK